MGRRLVGQGSTIGFRSRMLQLFEIFEWYLVRLYNRSMLSVAYKNDNSACLPGLIISPDPCFFLHCGFMSITLQP